MTEKRRSTDQPDSQRSRRVVLYVVVVSAVAVAAAFGAAAAALWLNAGRTSDAADLAQRLKALTVQTSRDTQQTRFALCALRTDLEVRVTSGQVFLAEHPHGIPGVPVQSIRDGIANQQRTIAALSDLDC